MQHIYSHIPTLRRCSFATGLLLSVLTVAEPADPVPDVPQLISQLGSLSFAEREHAEAGLVKLGPAALPALREQSDTADPEIRYRLRRVVAAIEQADHERRLKTFLANIERAEPADLPGWTRFAALVGDDLPARRLFAEMQRDEGSLLRIAEQTRGQLSAAFEQRCLEVQHGYATGQHNRLPLLGTFAALLFVANDLDFQSSEAATSLLASFLYRNEFRAHLAHGEQTVPMRKLFAAWIARPGEAAAYQKLMMAMQFDFKEGLVPAREILAAGAPAGQTQYAVLAFGKLGGADHIPELERLLPDTTVLTSTKFNEKTTFSCELRDLALAVILHLGRQDPRQYGFEQLQTHPLYVFSANTAGFADDEQRAAALRMWRDRRYGTGRK